MSTLRSGWLWALLLASAILAGCAQTGSSSASAGGTQAGATACLGQLANAHCYGGPP